MSSALLDTFAAIVGPRHVLTRDAQTRRYRQGFRFGNGRVLAVVRPGSLVEQWRVLRACVAADVIVITQAANTGLTGGSTPDGDDYDRPVVIVNTLRVGGIQLINDGRQVICLPGATLNRLEQALRPLGREPHSVIGSSCIGASVFGGVCNNSGGALVQRGPAYTQMALFAQVDAQGRLHLVNHLGVRLGDEPEAMLARLERGDYTPADIENPTDRSACDHGYADHVRDVQADTPARYNADPTRLYEASGCAGKLMVFAVRLDTFANSGQTRVFYIASNDPADLTALRRHILTRFSTLPVSGEYLHRTAFDIGARYGKDTFLMIKYLGTDRLPFFFGLKSRMDAWCARLPFLPRHVTDKLLQALSHLFPQHLPARLLDYRDRFEHHLMLKVAGPAIEEARQHLSQTFPTAPGDFFECEGEEGEKAFLLRFAVAGAAIRYRAVHDDTVEDIVALDIALKRNEQDWLETLPPEIEAPIVHKLYYGHFLCHVFHQDYIVAKGHDCLALEHAMWGLLDARGAEYPAEHNVGHLYKAKPALADFYRALDPGNRFNPGIGQTPKQRDWRA